MIERWCAWHRPVPILLERVGDGRVEIIWTHAICLDCLRKLERNRPVAAVAKK
ncbi:hypothetical protein ES705_42851 [subsurface metagenome]